MPQPIFLGGLISFYSTPGEDISIAYIYAGAMVLSCTLNVLLMHPYVLSQLHCGMKLRIAVCSMIYRKSLKLSKNALGETTAGQVVNLLSNDVSRLDLSIMFFHYLWVGPAETVLVTYLMYREVSVFIKLQINNFGLNPYLLKIRSAYLPSLVWHSCWPSFHCKDGWERKHPVCV